MTSGWFRATTARVARSLVGQVIADQFPPRRRLSFIGIGRSGGTDTSERATEIVGASRSSRGAGQADELLAEGFGRG